MGNLVRFPIKKSRPVPRKNSLPNAARPSDTTSDSNPGRTDGRRATVIAIGQVFQGTVPMRPETRSVLVRVVRIRKQSIQLHLTALPGSPRIAANKRRIWVATGDLETMIATGLAKPIRKLPCPSCGDSMLLFRGYVGKKSAIVFACNRCEEKLEV
jgi:predicted RNA-binding Zn-ribbon protein involved in translation (DUF1610 family)